VFVPTLNLLREQRSTPVAFKLVAIFGLIGIFTAFLVNEIKEREANYYELFGISARGEIDEKEIGRALRKKSILVHPDKCAQESEEKQAWCAS
jgi:preprotein translocase subunit Sec63